MTKIKKINKQQKCMHKQCKHSLGLIVGTFFGLLHLGWVVFVWLKLAKPLMDWILSLHSIQMDYSMLAFDFGRSAMLVVMTFAVGYVVGWMFSAICGLYC